MGCSKVSAGCQNCYAENMARRLAIMGFEQYRKVVKKWTPGRYAGLWNGNTEFVPSELEKPYKWKSPRTIFVGSMGDVFHESVDEEWINSIMEMTRCLPQHTFIFLTKRAQAMYDYFRDFPYGLKNVVVGVSVEDQATADARIPLLLQTPASKRFISIEPMIGPVTLSKIAIVSCPKCNDGEGWTNTKNSTRCHRCGSERINTGIDGIIVGGESGPKARPLNPDWVRFVRYQCADAGVLFMFKQWSQHKTLEQGG